MVHDWDDSPFGSSNLKYYKLCYEEITDEIIGSNLTIDACKLFMKNVTIGTVQRSVDVSIELEDWVEIEGPFEVTLGSTLIIDLE